MVTIGITHKWFILNANRNSNDWTTKISKNFSIWNSLILLGGWKQKSRLLKKQSAFVPLFQTKYERTPWRHKGLCSDLGFVWSTDKRGLNFFAYSNPLLASITILVFLRLLETNMCCPNYFFLLKTALFLSFRLNSKVILSLLALIYLKITFSLVNTLQRTCYLPEEQLYRVAILQ